jgi:hypothetical protein
VYEVIKNKSDSNVKNNFTLIENLVKKFKLNKSENKTA